MGQQQSLLYDEIGERGSGSFKQALDVALAHLVAGRDVLQ